MANVYSMQLDRGPWQLYDRLTAAAGAAVTTPLQFFATPIGGAKTKIDTNMTRGNVLPPPQKFSVFSIGFIVGSQMLLADVQLLLLNSFFEFKIGQKIFAEGPLQLYPAGVGVSGLSTRTAQAAVNNGIADVNARRSWGSEFSRDIPANSYFGVTVYPNFTLTAAAAVPNAGAGLDLMCVLDGIMDREVQ